MPGPDITPPKSKRAASLFQFLRYAIRAGAVIAVLAQPFAGHSARMATQLRSQAAPSQSAQPQTSQPQTSEPQTTSPAPPAGSSAKQAPDETGTFVIRKDVDEVLIHATVVDDKQHIVTDLDKSAFAVF